MFLSDSVQPTLKEHSLSWLLQILQLWPDCRQRDTLKFFLSRPIFSLFIRSTYLFSLLFQDTFGKQCNRLLILSINIHCGILYVRNTYNILYIANLQDKNQVAFCSFISLDRKNRCFPCCFKFCIFSSRPDRNSCLRLKIALIFILNVGHKNIGWLFWSSVHVFSSMKIKLIFL